MFLRWPHFHPRILGLSHRHGHFSRPFSGEIFYGLSVYLCYRIFRVSGFFLCGIYRVELYAYYVNEWESKEALQSYHLIINVIKTYDLILRKLFLNGVTILNPVT